MSTKIGLHKLSLRANVKKEDFEQMMSQNVFPTADNVVGSIDRGGQSAIQSQHLLRMQGHDNEYLWIIKYSDGVLSSTDFADLVSEMYDQEQQKIERFATHESVATYDILDSFDAGPRDTSGRTTGNPIRTVGM